MFCLHKWYSIMVNTIPFSTTIYEKWNLISLYCEWFREGQISQTWIIRTKESLLQKSFAETFLASMEKMKIVDS